MLRHCIATHGPNWVSGSEKGKAICVEAREPPGSAAESNQQGFDSRPRLASSANLLPRSEAILTCEPREHDGDLSPIVMVY